MTETSVCVSVVVPVYNDPEGIHTTLKALIDQSRGDYEILPVDNDSTDQTGDVISSVAADNADLVHPCEETEVQSSYAARNAGIRNGSGDIFIFLDAGVRVESTFVENVITSLESRNCDYLGCNVEVTVSPDPTFAERYELSLSFPVETYLQDKHFAPTCALGVRREVLDRVGIFDERLESGGDKEFGQRIYRAGFEQCYADDITAYHPARDSWSALRSKSLRIGRGSAQMRKYHPEIDGYHYPLHPINFLPPSPFRLRRRYSGEDVSLTSMVEFYLLEYALKLTQTYGALQETFTNWWSSHEDT